MYNLFIHFIEGCEENSLDSGQAFEGRPGTYWLLCIKRFETSDTTELQLWHKYFTFLRRQCLSYKHHISASVIINVETFTN